MSNVLLRSAKMSRLLYLNESWLTELIKVVLLKYINCIEVKAHHCYANHVLKSVIPAACAAFPRSLTHL